MNPTPEDKNQRLMNNGEPHDCTKPQTFLGGRDHTTVCNNCFKGVDEPTPPEENPLKQFDDEVKKLTTEFNLPIDIPMGAPPEDWEKEFDSFYTKNNSSSDGYWWTVEPIEATPTKVKSFISQLLAEREGKVKGQCEFLEAKAHLYGRKLARKKLLAELRAKVANYENKAKMAQSSDQGAFRKILNLLNDYLNGYA